MTQLRAATSSSPAHCNPWADRRFAACLDRATVQPWVVYSKPPFGGPLQDLEYLARYTHRVAIDNRRILDIGERGVKCCWCDRVHGNRPRTMLLPGVEPAAFLLHVLPRGFRGSGATASRSRAVKLAACCLALGANLSTPTTEVAVAATLTPTARCPACGRGQLIRRELAAASAPAILDSS